MTENIYVRFHIGRGGAFNNPGHLSFVAEQDFAELLAECEDLTLINSYWDEDKNEEVSLPDSFWYLEDIKSGNHILTGRDAIESDTGSLDFDGEYDTDYVTTTDKLNKKEIRALWTAYTTEEEVMSDKLKDVVCSLKGLKRVHRIVNNLGNFTAWFQEGCKVFLSDDYKGFGLEDIRKELKEDNWCPFSIEIILDTMNMKEWLTECEE